ncbi:MAG: SIS domain-containing protein [Cyanobacteria bacterium]|nr:SIS domain-containing protein [Cyanobacteriota bacterium]
MLQQEPNLTGAILRKADESTRVIAAFFTEHAAAVQKTAAAMAIRFQSGGQLFVMGNGGSACDAEHVSVEFLHPVFEKRKPLRAICLSSNAALLTALSNDIDFRRVFSRQLEQLSDSHDMALAISTSGMSANLIEGLKVAKSKGLLTIAFLGRDGGRMADIADYEFIVPSFSIHRIQEAHVVLLHVLWDCVHLLMGEEDLV